MTGKDDLARLLDYTVWANHRAMRATATAPATEFSRDLGASFGSLRGTLAHIMWVEWVWLERWKGLSPNRLPDESEFANILALRDRWTIIEDHRRAWLEALPESGVVEVIAYRTFEGRPYQAPLWQLVQHLANHSTYHRGQVTTMLRQLGARTVSTDLVTWDREREPS